jgi:hypothetical protein
MPTKVKVMILGGADAKSTTLGEVEDVDIVLAGQHDGTYKVIKNKWGDRQPIVQTDAVEAFLEACGVRSAT